MGSRFRGEVGLRQLPIIHSPAHDPQREENSANLAEKAPGERAREIPRSTRLHPESSKQLDDLEPPKLTSEIAASTKHGLTSEKCLEEANTKEGRSARLV